MNRFIVILGTLTAAGAAWLMKDVKGAERVSIRGDFRRGGAAAAPAVPGDPAAAPSAPGAAPGTNPAPAKPSAQKPAEPPKPAPPVFTREITDLVLPKAPGAADITVQPAMIVELHINIDADGEPSMSWHGAGKSSEMKGFAVLVRELGKKAGSNVVLAADEKATWQWCRWILSSAEEAFLPQTWIAAARPGEPKQLRGFLMPMTAKKDTPMPSASERFLISIKGETLGAPVTVTIDGKPLKDVAAEIKAAWTAWSAANKAWADTTSADRSRVVLEVPGQTPAGNVIPVIEAIRAAGIECFRLDGAIRPRPR